MGKNLFIFNFRSTVRKKAPRAFILFLVLFLITECLIFFTGPFFALNPVIPVFRAHIGIAEQKNIEKDILILGDSSAQFSLEPNTIQEISGLSCYNFATIGNGAWASNYFLLKTYLKNNRPPKYLLLMSVYDSWQREIFSEGVIDVLGSNFRKDTFKIFFNNDIVGWNKKYPFIRAFSTQILPSQRYKYEIIRMLRLAKNSKTSFFESMSKLIRRNADMKKNLLMNDGNYRDFIVPWLDIELYKDSQYLEKKIFKEMEKHLNFVENNVFYVSKLNTFYLNKIIKEARRKNAVVFLSLPPLLDEFYSHEKSQSYLSSVKAYIKSLEQNTINVHLLNEDFHVVTIEKLFDQIDHLKKDEANAFSERLAKEILVFDKIH